MKMKAPLLLAALRAGQLGVIAQTTLQVAVCDDLPPSIATDTTLQFTAQEVSTMYTRTYYLDVYINTIRGIH